MITKDFQPGNRKLVVEAFLDGSSVLAVANTFRVSWQFVEESIRRRMDRLRKSKKERAK